MALDPNIILAGGDIADNVSSPYELAQNHMTMGKMIGEQQDRQAIAENGFSPESTMSYLAKYDPKAAMGAYQDGRLADAQIGLQELKAQTEKLEQDKMQVDLIAQVASGVNDQASYTSALNFLRNKGIDVATMSPTYDPNVVRQYQEMSLTAKDRLDTQLAEMRNQTQAMYYQGMLQNQQARIQGDMAFREAQLGQQGEHNMAKLAQAEALNAEKMALAQQKAQASGGRSNRRVIERDGAIYIVDPSTNKITIPTMPDGSEYKTPTQRKNKVVFNQALTTLKEAKEILMRDKATSGGLQAKMSDAATFMGITTEGSKDAEKLNTLSAWLTSNTPRMEGPQSDKDVKLYREMAGAIGDRDKTLDQRKEAFVTVVKLLRKYQELNTQ